MRRVSIVGGPGSGKTTIGRRLAESLGTAYVELDSIFHQPGWRELPADEFRRRVAEVVAGETWVVDGNYTVVRDLVWQRADTVVCYTAAMADAGNAHLRFIRLRSPAEVAAFLAGFSNEV